MRYVEFAVTSNFSFLRGASHPEEMMAQASNLGLSGLGLADRNSVAGVVRAHLAKRESGYKLSYHPGARLVFADGTPDILVYPRDRAGWGRLCRLLTLGNHRAEKGKCILNRDDLLAHAEGLALIVMPPAALHDDFDAVLVRLREAAPENVWLAAAMLYSGEDRARLVAISDHAQRARIPLIAVNDVFYHGPERRPLQDVLTCIREHVTLESAGYRLAANAERHLKPPAEMARLFHDAPQAIAETTRLSGRLKFSLDELRYEYPDETREGFTTPQDALVHFTFAGAVERYPAGIPDKVKQSIDHELALIATLQYAPYFLTVHDIVRFARSRGILCQGRGSAANSAVCFCLGITEVDPGRIDLLFERFLSVDRCEPPDIDVDFEHERREEVIQYIYGRYGRERASLAATVISYRARSAIREVGKAFGLSEDSISAVASSIWGSGGDDIATANLRGAGLDAKSPRVRKIFDIVTKILSFPRHLSQHVGGFVITRGRLDEVVPIQNAAMEDRTCVEWDKDDLDALGILKIDVLGLGMLTCLRKALDLVQKHYGFTSPRLRGEVGPPARSEGGPGEGASRQSERLDKPPHPARTFGPRHPLPASGERKEAAPPRIDLSAIPPEEPAVYRMLERADSLGVFQVESRAQMTMLPRLKPKNFYDLVIEVAIVRPGPIQGDMVHPYLRRRQGIEPVTFPSRELEAVLGKTLGVPLFQEQAMKIAIVAAGFTPSEADRLRRAMATFRHVGTIGTFGRKMVEGMIANGYERKFAENCFRQIEGFGEYGFPESHAASFALLVYASSWLKCRYPDAFAAALLNAQPMGFYAPAQIVRDVREHGVEVRHVDINCSDYDSTLESSSPAAARLHEIHRDMAGDIRANRAIRLGLREIKGLRDDDAKTIVAHRDAGYDSLRDLWLRTSLSPRVLERLADADAFGSLGLSRRDALWAVKALGRVGDREDDLPLFRKSAVTSASGERETWREPDVRLKPMPLGEEVVNDYRFLKLSLRAHPATFLRSELAAQGIRKNEELRSKSSGSRVKISGLVTVRQRPGTAKGVIFMTIEDETAVANIIVWPKTFERFRAVVLGSRYIAVTGELQDESGVTHVVADRLDDLSHLLAHLAAEGTAIEALARADAVKHPGGEDHREKSAWRARRTPLLPLLTDMPDLASDLDVPARATRHAISKRM